MSLCLPLPVILSKAKDLKMRRPRILRSFGVFAPQDDDGLRPSCARNVLFARVAGEDTGAPLRVRES